MFKTASKLIGGSKPGCPPCVCNKQAQPVKAQPVKAQPVKKKKTPWYEQINQNVDLGGGWFDFGAPDDFGALDKRIRDIIKSGSRRSKKPKNHQFYGTRDGHFYYRDRRLLQPKYSVGDTIHWNSNQGGHAQGDGWYAKVKWSARDGRKVLGKKFYHADYMFFGAKRPRKTLGPTLKQLQNLARRNRVSVYKMRKDRRGYTKMPLTKKALKDRLSRARVSYKNLKAPRPRNMARPRPVTRKRYISRSPVRNMVLDPRRGCPAGKYKDPVTGRCKTIPKYEDLDELDSVNFSWNSDRTFGNRPLSMQYSRYGHSCFGDIPCDCGL